VQNFATSTKRITGGNSLNTQFISNVVNPPVSDWVLFSD